MNNNASKYVAYIGTYVSDKSKGIYIFDLDISTGTLKPIDALPNLENPSYLAVDRNNRYLYSVLETNEFKGQKGGAVCAFSINQQSGKLDFLNYQPTEGKAPCHISVDSNNEFLFAANYGEGTVSVFPIALDGSVGPISSMIRHEGTGRDKVRQDKPHAHYVALTPDEKLLCTVDLGIDRIMVFNFNRNTGCLKPADSNSIVIKPGSGPRHMEFHPNGKFVYVVNELSSDIVVLKYTPENSVFEQVQYISTLPKGYLGMSYCAAIQISSDGRYLYASNRGHDSIAIYKVDEDSGKLGFVSHSSTYGKFPRDFAIDPTGRYLFAANQNSDTIVSFKINPESGELVPMDSVVNIPNPVCIKFAVLSCA